MRFADTGSLPAFGSHHMHFLQVPSSWHPPLSPTSSLRTIVLTAIPTTLPRRTGTEVLRSWKNLYVGKQIQTVAFPRYGRLTIFQVLLRRSGIHLVLHDDNQLLSHPQEDPQPTTDQDHPAHRSTLRRRHPGMYTTGTSAHIPFSNRHYGLSLPPRAHP